MNSLPNCQCNNSLYGFLNNILSGFIYGFVTATWLAGFVLSKPENIWYCICPFYSWYLCVQKVMIVYGLV